MFNIFLFSGLLMGSAIGNGSLTYIQNLECSSSYFQVSTEQEVFNGENIYVVNDLKLIINFELETILRKGSAIYPQTTNGVLNIDLTNIVNDIYTFCDSYGGIELLKNEYNFYMVLDYITFNVSPSRSYTDSSKYTKMITKIDINFDIGLAYEENTTILNYSGLELIEYEFSQSLSNNTTYGTKSVFYEYNSVTYNNNNEMNYNSFLYGKIIGGETSYDNGYNVGYDLGYHLGYEAAVNSNPNNVLELITKPFVEMGKFLNISIAPNLTLGMIIAVPIVVAIIGFLIKALIA